MSYYRTCPHCGANLDPGERCSCREEQESRGQTRSECEKPAGEAAKRKHKMRLLLKADSEKLAFAIACACMNVNEVAYAANLHRATVYNVLTGCAVRPSTLGAIAHVLGVGLNEIVEDIMEQNAPASVTSTDRGRVDQIRHSVSTSNDT